MKKFLLLSGLVAAGLFVQADDLLAGLSQSNLKKESGNTTVQLIRHQGKPAIKMTGKTAEKKSGNNLYLNFSIMLPQPISLEGRTLKVQAMSKSGFPGFYVRAYNAGESKAAWSFLTWENILSPEPLEINLTRGRDRLLNWEAGMTTGGPADRINRIQFYLGTPDGNTEGELIITGLSSIPALSEADDKAPKSPNSVPEISRAVELPRSSTLVKGGQAVFEILHPDSEAGRKAAASVAETVREVTGAKVQFRPGTAADVLPEKTTILIGNLFSNPAFSVLYARQQTLADEYLPGPAGYTVESIIEPFVRGADIIVLGASDDDGLPLAAAAFNAAVKKHGETGKLELPILFETKYTAKISIPKIDKDYIKKGIDTAHQRLRSGQHTSLGGQLAGLGDQYRLTRSPETAKLYLEVCKIYLDHARKNKGDQFGAWGFDSDFPSYEALSGWDLIEHDEALSDEDRKTISQILLYWLHEAIAREAMGGVKGRGPVSNHLTFASMGTMMGAFYFDKYYGEELPQPKHWLDGIRKNFHRQAVSGKVHDDCQSYQWLTWRHLLVYAMAMPDDLVFRNGVARAMIYTMGLTMDNLWTQAPYGDSSGWGSKTNGLICADMYYAATRDPLAATLLKLKRSNPPAYGSKGFFGNVEVDELSTDLDGLQLLKLDKDYYNHTGFVGKKPPIDRTVDKFSFREKLADDALYVLVDGVNNGGHRHADANSVLRYSQFGRAWLAEAEYIKNQQKYHNSLLLLCNGEAFDLPDYMELMEKIDNDDYAMVKLRAAGVGPADWVRYYLWLKKEKAWALIDEVTPGKTAFYRLTQRWNGVGELTEKADGGELEQQGAAARVQMAPGTEISYYDDDDLGKQWSGYPFAKPIIRVIDQKIERELKAGEKARMIAVWHGADQGQPVPEWAVDRDGDRFLINTGSTVYTITPDAGGKFRLASAPATEPPAPRREADNGDQAAPAPAFPEEWKMQQLADGFSSLTDPKLRDSIKFELSGTEPAAANIFMAASNKLENLVDGSWSDGGDSVMFDPDKTVTLNFDFERPFEFTGLEIQAWWAGTSSRNTAYKLKTATVEFSNDKFRSDIRQASKVYDASGESHPNFGSPVKFALDFAPQTASSIRITLTPQAGTALYLAEIMLKGNVPKNLSFAGLGANLTRVIRLEDCLAVGSDSGDLYFYGFDGKLLGRQKYPDRINDIAAVDLDGDGEMELLLAGRDAFLRAVKRDGRELWKVPFERYRVYPDVTIVKVADLNNDGTPEILVGCDNWKTYAFNLKGKELWQFEVVHPTRAVEVADVDGDGKPEVLVGTRYYWFMVLSNEGKKRWGQRFGIGCKAVMAPLSGDGKTRNVVGGIDSGKVQFFTFDGKAITTFNTGDEIFMMALGPEKNGRQDLFVSSFNGYVYRFTADGKNLWSSPMPSSVVVLKSLPNGGVVAGTVNGEVGEFDADGKLVRLTRLEGRINDILVDGDTLRIVTSQGILAALKL